MGVVALFALVATSAELGAQDKITVKDPRTGKTSQFAATIVSWDAERLVYTGNGRQSIMPSSRVIEVAYSRTPGHLQADQQFDAGQFLQAWQSYQNAAADEPREWVKVEMVARQLRCAIALNRQRDALSAFFTIQQATPGSRHFHLIPIPWDKSRPDGTLLQVYNGWLSGSDDTQKLIAASWLLQTDESAATRELKTLAQSPDSRIAHLATAQLWRPQTIAAKTEDVKRWQAAVQRMPEQFQAGPRFLIALASRQMNRSGNEDMFNRALVGMLQIPILFPEHYQTAGAALLEAYQMLVASGRTDEANIVLNELKRDFALSNAALSLGARIENLDQ